MEINLKELRSVFETINQESCPKYLNFHMHTTCSDGSLTPLQLIKQAINSELRHLAITDHHSINGYLIASQWLASHTESSDLPKLWSGIEISCLLNKCLVHVLGYGFNINSSYLKPYICHEAPIGYHLQASSVIEAIHNSGGICILAHPARYRLDYKILIDCSYKLNFDGIETWYDYEMSNKWRPTSYLCDSIYKYTSRYNMLNTCGTDTHGMSLLAR